MQQKWEDMQWENEEMQWKLERYEAEWIHGQQLSHRSAQTV